MMRRLALASALFVAVGSAAPSMAVAGTASSDLNISSSVTNNCIISTTALSFGAYDPISGNATTNQDANGTVSTTCTKNASATITLGQGSNAGTGSTDAAPNRQLAAAGNRLAYVLYQDSSRTNAWGNTSGTGLSFIGSGAAETATVYGAIPAGQNVPAGAYTDTVTANVSF